MKKITYITDPEVLNISIIECGETMIDIKNQCDILFGEPPECELTKNDYTKIRKTVFEKLCEVQAKLPNGYRLRLYEGFRSLTVQQMLFADEYQRVIARYPDETAEYVFHETTRLVSPVTNFDGSANVPAHNTGAAVDVEIIDQQGKLIDMGMAAKDWIMVDPDLCLTHCDKISEQAVQNRQLLLTIMEQHGFINYPTEWWHFSYGDRYWAHAQSVDHAMYGSADKLST